MLNEADAEASSRGHVGPLCRPSVLASARMSAVNVGLSRTAFSSTEAQCSEFRADTSPLITGKQCMMTAQVTIAQLTSRQRRVSSEYEQIASP